MWWWSIRARACACLLEEIRLLNSSLLIFQALSLVCGVPASGHISSVVANRVGTGVELVVKGESLQKPRVFPYLNGKFLIVQFEAGMDGVGGKSSVNYGGVRSYEMFWYSATPQ